MNIQGFFRHSTKGKPIDVLVEPMINYNPLNSALSVELICSCDAEPEISQRFTPSNFQLDIVGETLVFKQPKNAEQIDKDRIDFNSLWEEWSQAKKAWDIDQLKQSETAGEEFEIKPYEVPEPVFDYPSTIDTIYPIPTDPNGLNVISSSVKFIETIMADFISIQFPTIKNYIV